MPNRPALMRTAALVLFGLVGLLHLVHLTDTLSPDFVEKKDFAQDYLLAKAVSSGVDPYLSLRELGERYGVGVQPWEHPSAHPPSLAVLSLPLALTTYRAAAALWLAFGLACLVVSLRVMFGLRVFTAVFFALASLLWDGVFQELRLGQVTMPMLLALALTWRSLRSKVEIKGGMWLGMALSIKPLAWPLVVYLLFKKRWKAAAAALALCVFLNFAAAFAVGFRPVLNYPRVAAGNTAVYRGDAHNFSAWTFGRKLFDRTYTANPARALAAPPLVSLPALAVPASVVFVLLLTALGFNIALRGAEFDIAFAALVCASIVVSPVVWVSYLPLALLPLAVAAARPGKLFSASVFLLAFTPTIWEILYATFGYELPRGAGLLTLLPLSAPLCLMASLRRPTADTRRGHEGRQ